MESQVQPAVARDTWSSKWEFLLSCVGLSVGFGNVWRFPYLAFKNGGGSFLIPYFIVLFLVGKPMYFLELAMGQFASRGPVRVWRCAPVAHGIGIAWLLLSFFVSIYYNVVMAYTLFFIGHSFQDTLPWDTCDWTNDTNCIDRDKDVTITNGTKTPSQLFWERQVLDISSGIEEQGSIKWDLALCLLISWTIVLFCLIKGIRSSGKVVYFTATFPYIVLFVLLGVGAAQPGAWEGIKLFITPKWEELSSIAVWQDATSQVFYSLSVAMGALVMYGSYNDFRHNVFRDAMIVSMLDTITSVIAGLVIFSALGAMANSIGTQVKDVVNAGPGLTFVAYPEAITKLPLPQLNSLLFFLMLLTLGLDTEFALVENILTSLADEFETFRRHKSKLCVAYCLILFLLGLSCVTRGGQYVFNLVDDGCGFSMVFIAIAECLAFGWAYGYQNLKFDIKFMLNRNLSHFWYVTWCFTSPIILVFIFVLSLGDYKALTYGSYYYPLWAQVVRVLLVLVIILPIPGWAIYHFHKQKDDTFVKKLKSSLQPASDWGPRLDSKREEWTNIKSGSLRMSPMKIQKVELKKVTRQKGIDNPAFDNEFEVCNRI